MGHPNGRGSDDRARCDPCGRPASAGAFERRLNQVPQAPTLKSRTPDYQQPFSGDTGVDLAPTLAFARRLARLNKSAWIRYVLVPALTDDLVHIARLGDFLRELGPIVERVDVLPFHRLGAHKWKTRGLDYKLTRVDPPSVAQVAEAVRIPRERGLPAE